MEDENHLNFHGPKGEIIFVVMTILYFTVARFLAVLVHEVLGHGLVSELIGGEFYAVYISPGPGFTSAFIPDATPAALHVTYLMAGLIAEWTLGILILVLVYPRLRSFYHRLFTLLLLEVLLIHSFTYMALGSFLGQGGDTQQAVGFLPGLDVFWEIRFMITGIFFIVIFALLVSKMALELLQEHFVLRSRRSALRLLLLFWLPHLTVGLIAGLLGMGLISDDLLNYLLFFTLITALALVLASFLASRRLRPNLNGTGIERRGLIATLIAFLLVISVWFLAFGATPSTAHGILLRDPPAEAESGYTEYYAVNVHVMISKDLNVTVEVRLKAFGDVSSPLEQAIWESFQDRPDWDAYHLFGLFVAKNTLNTSSVSWVNNDSVGVTVHGMGDVWQGGKMVTFEHTGPNTSLFGEKNGNWTLFIYDPWKSETEPGGQYLDALNISWEEPIKRERIPQGGGLDPVAEGSTYVTWIFSSYEEAHIVYELWFSTS